MFDRRGLVWSLPLFLAAALAFGAPARAGDDCGVASYAPWSVSYDIGCIKEIYRTVRAADGNRDAYVSFVFLNPPSKGLKGLVIQPDSAASSVTIRIGRRPAVAASRTDAAGTQFDFTGGAANDALAALRRKQNITIAITYRTGARQSLTLDGANFDTAYRRLVP